jgi:hypothetical protein
MASRAPSGKTKDLYGSAVLVSKEAAWRAGTQAQLPSQPGLLGAATSSNKSKWHNVTRPEALAARAGGAGPRIQVQKNQNQSFQPNLKLPRNGPGLWMSPSPGIHITRSWRLDRYRRQHANLRTSRRNFKLTPTKNLRLKSRTRMRIVYKRKILITDKCSMVNLKASRNAAAALAGKMRVLPGRSVQMH